MSDLDQLDRAFDALTRDLAHTHGPGAAAAMATARTRRRTRVGAVALATALVVGGGLTVPRLLFPADGVAANGGSARFDAAAIAQATDGWIGEWETWEQHSPWGGGSFGVPSCSYAGRPDREPAPQPMTLGSSRFVSRSGASATVVVTHYADAEVAASGSGLAVAVPDSCGTTTTYDVDGVQVRHDSMPPEGDSVGDRWMGDVWSARIGADRAHLEVINDTGVADDATAEEVAEALVAGLRDGWTQSGMEEVAPEDPPAPPLPEWTDVDLEGAFAGWRSPTRRAATTSPNLLCLHDRLDGSTAGLAVGGSRWGLSYRVAGYQDPAEARANVDLVLDELRACTS